MMAALALINPCDVKLSPNPRRPLRRQNNWVIHRASVSPAETNPSMVRRGSEKPAAQRRFCGCDQPGGANRNAHPESANGPKEVRAWEAPRESPCTTRDPGAGARLGLARPGRPTKPIGLPESPYSQPFLPPSLQVEPIPLASPEESI